MDCVRIMSMNTVEYRNDDITYLNIRAHSLIHVRKTRDSLCVTRYLDNLRKNIG